MTLYRPRILPTREAPSGGLSGSYAQCPNGTSFVSLSDWLSPMAERYGTSYRGDRAELRREFPTCAYGVLVLPIAVGKQFLGPCQNRIPHRFRQLSGLSVLSTNVVAAEHHRCRRQRKLGSVAERRSRTRDRRSPSGQVSDACIPGDRAERQHHPDRQQLQLSIKKRRAPVQLVRHRAVVGRHASQRRHDVRAAQFQTVAALLARSLVREAGAKQPGVQKLSPGIAGKHPPASAGAVSSGGQSNNCQAGARIPKSGHWPRPVLPISVRAPLLLPYLLAPTHQARTSSTLGDLQE